MKNFNEPSSMRGRALLLSAQIFTRKLKIISATLFFFTAIVAGCKKEIQQPAQANAEIQGLKDEAASVSATAGYYTIATYNTRRTTSADVNQRAWTFRRPLVKDMILKYGFDLFGVQEPIGPQIDNMVTDLPAYSRFGTSDHNNHSYQHQDIFYKKDRFTLLTSGKFWMAPNGPTTHTCNGTNDFHPWDSYYHACVCTWGKFRDKLNGQVFYVFNTHFDPGGGTSGTTPGETARQQSANVVLSKIQSIAGTTPTIFMGDLNANQNTVAYATLNNSALLQESWDLATVKTPAAYRQTGNWWNPTIQGQSQIDHIFVTSQWEVKSRAVLWDNYDTGGYTDVMPSDHNPVMTEMKINSLPPKGTFDDFTSGVGHYTRQPTYSGSTGGIATTSTATQITGGYLQLTLNDNTAVTTNWFVRLLSGDGIATNNVLTAKTGELYFWLKTSNAGTSAQARIWVDDSDGTEQSAPINIINDGAWHRYTFNLATWSGVGAVNGNGVLDASAVTLDAIILSRPNSSAQWVALVDDVGN